MKLQRYLRTYLTLLLCFLLLYQQPHAQTDPSDKLDKATIHQALLDLTNPWTVMCVAAHPDDEDGSTLTILRRKYGVHTVSLFSTFGEGGQNAVGPELYEQLGVIRARETMAAAEVQGPSRTFSASAILVFQSPPKRRFVRGVRKSSCAAWCFRFACCVPT